jgi:archaellum component FlaC
MKRLIPVVAVLLLAGAACDDDVSSACEAQQKLESSVDDLRNIDVVDDGVDALRTDVDAVADNLATFRAEAGTELEPDVDAVQAAVDQVRSTLESSGTPAELASSLATDVSDLAAAWNELKAASQNLCD